MKKYTKLFMEYHGYTIAGFIPCATCGKRAVDIHHIETRKRRKDLENDINNLIALCRECHIKYGEKKQYMDFLKQKNEAK